MKTSDITLWSNHSQNGNQKQLKKTEQNGKIHLTLPKLTTHLWAKVGKNCKALTIIIRN